MYRKQADRLIVRDVRRRLQEMPEPDWRSAVVASMHAHPDWYRHQGAVLDEIGQLLQSAGVALVSDERKRGFIGNEAGYPDD